MIQPSDTCLCFFYQHALFSVVVEPSLPYPKAQKIEQQLLDFDPVYLALISDIRITLMNSGQMITVNGLSTIARLFHAIPAWRPYHKDTVCFANSYLKDKEFATGDRPSHVTYWEESWYPGQDLDTSDDVRIGIQRFPRATYRPTVLTTREMHFIRAPIRFTCVARGMWPSRRLTETDFWTSRLQLLRRWGERAAIVQAGWVANKERLSGQSCLNSRPDWGFTDELFGLCIPNDEVSVTGQMSDDEWRAVSAAREAYKCVFYT